MKWAKGRKERREEGRGTRRKVSRSCNINIKETG